ncbi:MAG TPA: AAA family ATPase, partial [Bacillota bacterium]
MPGDEVLAVTVRRFRYRGDDGYAVAECATGEGEVTVVGFLPQVLSGERLTLTGEWTEHPRYGRQFRAARWQLPSPDDPDALIHLIAGAGLEGVGPELARRLVEHLGPQAPQRILHDPDCLLEVPGIGPVRRDRIARAVAERFEALETAAELQRLGIPPDVAWRLQARWGSAAVEQVRADPYQALTALPGLPFRALDAAAVRAGADPDDPRRLDAALLYAVREATWEEGHVYLPAAEAAARALQRLRHAPPGRDIDPEHLFRRRLEVLADAGELVVDDGERVYLPALYEAEVDLVDHLRRLGTGRSRGVPAAPPVELPHLDPQQVEAVRTALTHPLTVITGGPGTGKTLTIRALLAAAAGLPGGCRAVLAAPTGRAARRLAEVTGQAATTLHRLLEATPPQEPEGQEAWFRRDEDHPLEGDLLVVDEASMLDVLVGAALFRAVPDAMRVVLVGDADQLPPVGPGRVLGDLIAAGIPCVRLHRVYRQSEGSAIAEAAHAVRQGRLPSPDAAGGLEWEPCRDAGEAVEHVLARAQALAAAGVPLSDWQVLAPMRQGPAGVEVLNRRLQAVLNPGRGMRVGDQELRLGDKVMCTRNHYEKGRAGVFNGHMGVVTRLEPEQRAVEVDFDGDAVVFEEEELADLRLAYCSTVHKSQGSEFDTVILCL